MSRSALVLALLGACSANHDAPVEGAVPTLPEPGVHDVAGQIPVSEPTPVQAPAPPAEAEMGAYASGLLLPSLWASPACEGRSYERHISFEEGRFRASDLVSPCPPGVPCVWSGIIDRAGSWALEGQQLRLIPDTDAATPAQAGKFPLPDRLWLSAEDTLTEDDGACPYVMAPSG